MNKTKYQKVLDKNQIKRPIWQNSLRAFIIGGFISIIAQGLLHLFIKVFNLDIPFANSLMSVTLIFIASILTGLGIYDKLGQYAGVGTIIPITGFSNTMTSAAMESKSEGIILGIMSNMFKLAGAIIVAGIVSAFISGTIIYLVNLW